MLGPALVPKKEAVPATRTGTAIAAIGPSSVPVQVTNAIRDLMVSFASQVQDTADSRRLFEIFVEATKHVHRAVAEEAVKSLLFDNPRNPYRPSPQDVYERCNKINSRWAGTVRNYYFLEPGSDRFPLVS